MHWLIDWWIDWRIEVYVARTNQIVAFEYVSRTTEIGTDQITSLGYACMNQSVRVSEYRSLSVLLQRANQTCRAELAIIISH